MEWQRGFEHSVISHFGWSPSIEMDLRGVELTKAAQGVYTVPFGNLTVCYWKWPFIVSFPIKNGDFP